MLFVILCQDMSIVMLAAVAWLSVEKIATAASISDALLRSCCCCWMMCWHEDNAMCDAPLKRLPLLSHDVLPRSCQHIYLFYSTTVGLSYSLPFLFHSTERFFKQWTAFWLGQTRIFEYSMSNRGFVKPYISIGLSSQICRFVLEYSNIWSSDDAERHVPIKHVSGGLSLK